MSRNRKREPLVEPAAFRETLMFIDQLTHEDLVQVVFKLLDHLKLNLVRTNCTKHGDTQLLLEPEEDDL